MIKCNECAADLGEFKTLPSPRLRWVWLICNDWKTRVSFCEGCVPNDLTIKKLSQGTLQKWGLKPCQSLKWGEATTLEEYCALACEQKCRDCEKPLDNDPVRDGWKMYHKKCRGISANRYKPKVA